MFLVFKWMVIGALVVGLVINLFEFFDTISERRHRPDPRTFPTYEVDKSEIPAPTKITTGEIHPGYIRYHDGMIVNNYTGQVIWPNSDGSYDWRDDLFPIELQKKLQTITS